jgi:hypothetical protein
MQYFIPYTGQIREISAADAKKLSVLETEVIARDFEAKIQKITDAGIAFDRAMPAVAGAIIIACDNPQGVYDAVFGTSQLRRASNVVSFVASEDKKASGALTAAFGECAEKYPVLRQFRAAACPAPAKGNDNRAPELIAA